MYACKHLICYSCLFMVGFKFCQNIHKYQLFDLIILKSSSGISLVLVGWPCWENISFDGSFLFETANRDR